MRGCHKRSIKQAHSPLKSMLRKFSDKYQSYFAIYKTHDMTTCHRGTGHTGEDRELNSHIDDTGCIDKSPSNNNESTNISDTKIAFRGLEADGCLDDPLHRSQANLTVLTREINSLQ